MSWVSVVVVVNRGVGRSAIALEVACDAAQCFGGTVERVRVGTMAHSFATNGILLVREGQTRMRDAVESSLVIQRCRGRHVDRPPNGEADVAKAEGLGASFGGVAVEAFAWSQEPMECDDDEVDDMFVECAMDRVIGVEGCGESSENGDIGGVGSRGRFVFVAEALEESSEHWMVSFGSRNLFSGIVDTQVGEPLAHRQWGFVHCVSSDRLVGGSVTSATQGEDEHVAQFVFLAGDSTEGGILPEFATMFAPLSERGAVGVPSLSNIGFAGLLQSKAEVSLEASSRVRWSRRQGSFCGWACSK